MQFILVYYEEKLPQNPCLPSPCGLNSICRVQHDHPVCSCTVGFIGAPPNCRPECVINAECPSNKACSNNKCVDPCPGTCGFNAHCRVLYHAPVCSCPVHYTGNAFISCTLEESTFSYEVSIQSNNNEIILGKPVIVETPKNPCVPSPCGPFSDCKNVGNRAACSCLPYYFGQPPNCRPECMVNSDCSPSKACQNTQCYNPCAGSCGPNAECMVVNHAPVCKCRERFTGDPFSGCNRIVESKKK